MRLAAFRPALLGACLLAAVACAPGTPATPAPSDPTASPAATVPGQSASSPDTTPSTPVADARPDEGLLAMLPAEVDGIPVTAEPLAFEEAVTDPDFVGNVEAAAFFAVVGEADIASGVLADLRPGTWSEAFFRDWRGSYDEGACAQSGGIAGRAEAQLGGRTTYITSCTGGLFVHHAYVPERDVLVSILSAGEARFGEQLMRGLHP
jgi:hypothetical protein